MTVLVVYDRQTTNQWQTLVLFQGSGLSLGGGVGTAERGERSERPMWCPGLRRLAGVQWDSFVTGSTTVEL